MVWAGLPGASVGAVGAIAAGTRPRAGSAGVWAARAGGAAGAAAALAGAVALGEACGDGKTILGRRRGRIVGLSGSAGPTTVGSGEGLARERKSN